VVPLWDTPWDAEDWAERQRQVLDAPDLIGADGLVATAFARSVDPQRAGAEPHEALWTGVVHGDGQGGYLFMAEPDQTSGAGSRDSSPWPLITLEPGLNHWLQGLDRPTPARLIGCANPWGPWLRASRLAPD
jgi:hypothetical protein